MVGFMNVRIWRRKRNGRNRERKKRFRFIFLFLRFVSIMYHAAYILCRY
jgi:hypothetical protein